MASLRNMSFGDALDAHLVLDALDDAEVAAREKAEQEARK